jgi:hypothetical protein
LTGISENINKQCSLGMLDGARAAEYRHPYIGAGIDEQTPENRVGYAVKALETE